MVCETKLTVSNSGVNKMVKFIAIPEAVYLPLSVEMTALTNILRMGSCAAENVCKYNFCLQKQWEC